MNHRKRSVSTLRWSPNNMILMNRSLSNKHEGLSRWSRRWSPDTMNHSNRSVSNEHLCDLQIPWTTGLGHYQHWGDLQIPWSSRTGHYLINTKMLSRYDESQEQVSISWTPRWSPDTMNLRNRSVSNILWGDFQIPWASGTGQYLINTDTMNHRNRSVSTLRWSPNTMILKNR